MLCEKYKPALIESAITGADLAPAIRAHVETCPSCAAELVQQRSLIAATNTNLHRQMNAPTPAAMLQRFEVHLSQQQPARSLNLRWMYLTAALVAVSSMIVFAVPRVRTHRLKLDAALTPTSKSPAAPRPESITAILPPAAPREMRREKKQHSRGVARTKPEILVPPDEQIALTRFIAHWNAQREVVVALAVPVRQSPEALFKGLEIPDINTAEIIIEPIATESRR